MTLRRAPVYCKVKESLEVDVCIHIVCYLQSRVRVKYASSIEKRPEVHYKRFS